MERSGRHSEGCSGESRQEDWKMKVVQLKRVAKPKFYRPSVTNPMGNDLAREIQYVGEMEWSITHRKIWTWSN
jgi:hypothetical protein